MSKVDEYRLYADRIVEGFARESDRKYLAGTLAARLTLGQLELLALCIDEKIANEQDIARQNTGL